MCQLSTLENDAKHQLKIKLIDHNIQDYMINFSFYILRIVEFEICIFKD